MSDTVIKVENLSKRYIIGHQQSGRRYVALRDVLTNSATQLLRRITGRGDDNNSATREEFWALKNLSFEIQRGDCVGIVGRNGAGKSTLLKILSRITEPTSGKITLRGRISSMLEVGTGFHPELTGRENIFLNGAILGMKREMISRKFDEIVAFSEVEKFLDTPVKYYSSGMYMRLAFAVAAHLETDILVIDEVLAVGDAQFQKKCLGKMGDVTKSGKTLFFVSHNMGAIAKLCNRGILLQKGELKTTGSVEEVIKQYNELSGNRKTLDMSHEIAKRNLTITGFKAERLNPEKTGPEGHTWMFTIEAFAKIQMADVLSAICIEDQFGHRILTLASRYFGQSFQARTGPLKFQCFVKSFPLGFGVYKVKLFLGNSYQIHHFLEESLELEIPPVDFYPVALPNSNEGAVITDQIWSMSPSNS